MKPKCPAAQELRDVALQFACYGECLTVGPYGTGHINDTYCAVFDQAGTRVRYILQRINQHVFKNPPGLMENVERVTRHLANKLADKPDSGSVPISSFLGFMILTRVRTRSGAYS